MVDRIVPATTEADRALVSSRLGVEDAWPVMTEPFRQWVIEDQFAAGRPRFEDSGAELVADVAPYELMKLRLLNGATRRSPISATSPATRQSPRRSAIRHLQSSCAT